MAQRPYFLLKELLVKLSHLESSLNSSTGQKPSEASKASQFVFTEWDAIMSTQKNVGTFLQGLQGITM